MNLKQLMAATALALVSTTGHAQAAKAGAITVDHPYARTTAAGQPVGGGFVTLVNAGGADRLLSASAAISKSVELHMMAMDGDVMRMRQVDAIELGAGKTVELKPGGYHLMFIGLKGPLKAGASFPMTLKFEKAGEMTVTVKVEAPGAPVR